VWFDGGAIPVEKGGPDLIPILQRHQPNAIVFQGPPGTPNMIRWVGNERGVAPYPCWSTANSGTAEDGTEEKNYGGDPYGRIWTPGECDVPVRNHDWFWMPDHEDRLYSLSELMEMYYCSVGRNCNLLLNANPGPDGLVPETDFQRYVEFGKEIQRCFATPIAATQGEGVSIELDLEHDQKINQVTIMEDIAHGERILEYVVEHLAEGDTWQTLCSGACVGHTRIHQFDTVLTSRIRLKIAKTKAGPHVRRLAAHFVTETA